MKIDRVSCFCTSLDKSGNPAAIISDFVGSVEQKQELAYKINFPVSVFISKKNTNLPLLEYFYPHAEMPLCLHGTIAAAYILFKNSKNSLTLSCKTKLGKILNIYKRGGILEVDVSSQAPLLNSFIKIDIYRMLGIQSSDVDTSLPFQIASVGSPKLLIPIIFLKKLIDLRPDFDAIKQWSIASQINGFYVYTKETISDQTTFHARGFNPRGGYIEDAATGVAAAALGSVLKKDIIVEQGYVINKPSELLVHYQSPEKILVGGRVILQ